MTTPAWLAHITRPIRTDDDHRAALVEIERLWDSVPGTPECDRLEVIGILVNDYERERWPMGEPKHPSESTQAALDELSRLGQEMGVEGLMPRSPRKQLVDLMGTISEQRWCAGWCSCLEFVLWREVAKGPEHDGDSDMPVARLRKLSHEVDGWWVWDRTMIHERFVTMAEWLPMYDAWEAGKR